MGRSLISLLSKQNNCEYIDYKAFVSSAADITPKNAAIIDFAQPASTASYFWYYQS